MMMKLLLPPASPSSRWATQTTAIPANRQACSRQGTRWRQLWIRPKVSAAIPRRWMTQNLVFVSSSHPGGRDEGLLAEPLEPGLDELQSAGSTRSSSVSS